MNIKVSTRVFSGFAIIIAIILINSIFTWRNLSTIDSGNTETNTVALPTLAHSNALKHSFIDMSITILEAFHSNSTSDIEQKAEILKTQNDMFSNELLSLETIANKQPALQPQVQKVASDFKRFSQQSKNLIQQLLNRTSGESNTADVLFEIEDNIDTLASYVLDISDFDDVTTNPDVKRLESTGIDAEDAVITLYSRAEEYAKTESLLRANTMASELDIFRKNANNAIIALTKINDILPEGHESKDVVEQIELIMEDINRLLEGPNSLISNHQTYLNSKNNAISALNLANEVADTSKVTLDKLLKQAEQRAGEITSTVTRSVDDGQMSNIAIVIISTLIASVVAMFSARAISRPLNEVNNILQVVSSGDLTQRLAENSSNEFGVLARNCNHLIDNLTALISSIASRSEQLATASEQTSTITEQTTMAIADQKSQIAQIATATTELSSTSEQMFHNAAQSVTQIESTNSESGRVRDISLENKTTILSLAKEVEQASDVINKLHKDSNDIGGILDVIRGIAEQTNLLALNAAIEAARAGEQGRGFAVVADEVRTLASRTQESTQEIQNMIELLQSGAQRAVQVMEQGQEQTRICVSQSEKAVEALDTISRSVAAASDGSKQIEESAKEQNTVSQQVSNKLESIVAIAEQTSVGAEQTSESSLAVSKLADELKASIAQFKV